MRKSPLFAEDAKGIFAQSAFHSKVLIPRSPPQHHPALYRRLHDSSSGISHSRTSSIWDTLQVVPSMVQLGEIDNSVSSPMALDRSGFMKEFNKTETPYEFMDQK